jgi:glycerophosphoryl diester phosphodiesterase
LEIKTKRIRNRHLVERTVKAIAAFGLEEHCLISSFNPFVLREVKRVTSTIATAVIYANHPKMPRLLRRGQGSLLTGCNVLKPEYSTLLKGRLSFFERNGGKPLLPWTVNNPEDAGLLPDENLFGVISDDPARIREALSFEDHAP